MKEKFIYPLLAILLTVISTNVSATTDNPTDKTLFFSWQGSIDLINPFFDWKFVNADTSDYIPPKNNDLDMRRKGGDTDTTGEVNILGDSMNFFIVPVSMTEANILNTVSAKISTMPIITGLNKGAGDLYYEEISNSNKNQISILMNDQHIAYNVATTPIDITATKVNSYPVKISLKSQIIGSNYTNGKILQISVPVIFSVELTPLNP